MFRGWSVRQWASIRTSKTAWSHKCLEQWSMLCDLIPLKWHIDLLQLPLSWATRLGNALKFWEEWQLKAQTNKHKKCSLRVWVDRGSHILGKGRNFLKEKGILQKLWSPSDTHLFWTYWLVIHHLSVWFSPVQKISCLKEESCRARRTSLKTLEELWPSSLILLKTMLSKLPARVPGFKRQDVKLMSLSETKAKLFKVYLAAVGASWLSCPEWSWASRHVGEIDAYHPYDWPVQHNNTIKHILLALHKLSGLFLTVVKYNVKCTALHCLIYHKHTTTSVDYLVG